MTEPGFILASSSPRRKDLLKMVNIHPKIISPEFEETRLPGESIDRFLERVSIGKGSSIRNPSAETPVIISADTIVVLDGDIIGKPKDRQDAHRILKRLSGMKHTVITGIAIRVSDRVFYDSQSTMVTFDHISESQLEYYLENEHYLDKAGAYAVQGLAAVFIKRIEGCYFNVMGFPLNMFFHLLKRAGIPTPLQHQ